MMFASCDSKLGSALVAVGTVTPWRLLGQHICNTEFLSDSDYSRQDEEQGNSAVNTATQCRVTRGRRSSTF